jgi:multidrug resistance protein, MATE family
MVSLAGAVLNMLSGAENPPDFRRELARTLRLALPLIAAQLFAIGTNVVDVLLAGHLSPHVLGAVAIGAAIWSLPLMTISGLMMALSPGVAQLDGASRRHLVVPLFRQALWLGFGAGILLAMLVHWGAPFLVARLAIAPDLVGDVQGFLRMISFGVPALGIYFACRGLSEGLSVTRPTMICGFCGLLLLAPIGYVLMYGAFDHAGLGARGSGIATAIVAWLQALGFATYVRWSRRYTGLDWRAGRRLPDRATIFGLLRVGAPMAVSVLMEVGIFTASGLLIGHLGDNAVAAHQIALNVASVTFMVPLGLALAITVRVGNAVGRGDRPGIRRAGLAGLTLVLGTQLCSSALILAIPRIIAGIYTRDAAVLAGAVTLLRLAGLFQLSDGIQVASNGALRGLKDTKAPMFITTFAYWGIGMPLGWWLGFPLGMGARGVWIGLIAGLTGAACLLFLRFNTLSRHPIKPAATRLSRVPS